MKAQHGDVGQGNGWASCVLSEKILADIFEAMVTASFLWRKTDMTAVLLKEMGLYAKKIVGPLFDGDLPRNIFEGFLFDGQNNLWADHGWSAQLDRTGVS